MQEIADFGEWAGERRYAAHAVQGRGWLEAGPAVGENRKSEIGDRRLEIGRLGEWGLRNLHPNLRSRIRNRPDARQPGPHPTWHHQVVDTCCSGVRGVHAPSLQQLRKVSEAPPSERPKIGDPGRRAESHRPGHRVRLLLPCRLCAARSRLRTIGGQLQSGDGEHRLRHLTASTSSR